MTYDVARAPHALDDSHFYAVVYSRSPWVNDPFYIPRRPTLEIFHTLRKSYHVQYMHFDSTVLQVSGILVLHVKGIFSQYVICMPHARKRGGDAQGGLWAAGSPQNRSGTFALTNLIPTLAAMSLSSNPAPFECSPPRQKRRVHATTFHLNTWTWRNHINYHANG